MIKENIRFEESCVFEGLTSIRALIDNLKNNVHNARKIEKIYVDESKAEKKYKEINYLSIMAKEYGFSIETVSKEEIDKYSIGSSHGGFIAFCGERHYKELEENDIENNGFYVYVEGIEDPYNFGYSLRSIYASGADGIILSKRNWLSSAGVVCRSSAGASERINIYIDNGNCVGTFKQKNYKIVCADIKNSVSVYEADLKKPLFLIVGGEKRGISSSLLSSSDTIVRIDYGRRFDESLSAASASTILAFEVYRQNK